MGRIIFKFQYTSAELCHCAINTKCILYKIYEILIIHGISLNLAVAFTWMDFIHSTHQKFETKHFCFLIFNQTYALIKAFCSKKKLIDNFKISRLISIRVDINATKKTITNTKTFVKTYLLTNHIN